MEILQEFWHNFTHNLFKPLLLFFYMGFAVPLLRVPFEFPRAIYQGLTMYLLVAIGWHGGEELARMSAGGFYQAAGFIAIGFCTNFIIGIIAYFFLRRLTRLRNIDAATVAGFYGSDSAGTFVTCLGVLAAANIAYAAYMPVLLAVMEIPGCLVALFLVSRLRAGGMDPSGNMPGEPGYSIEGNGEGWSEGEADEGAQHAGHGEVQVAVAGKSVGAASASDPALKSQEKSSGLNLKVLHEVFLNPGLFLLFGGILIGFLGQLQGPKVTADDDPLFLTLFHGALCLFLLEMGITACRRLKDLKTAGLPFIAFGILAPIVFATFGILIAHAYSMIIQTPFDIGTYALFSVLCAAASYIAVPAVQRLAIPEASPTLPLAASLGLTFSFNVTAGIPIYIEIAKFVTHSLPVG